MNSFVDREPVVSLKQISKRFGDLNANDRLSVDLYEGEVHAFLGENGAGKTTLMNILSGVLQPDKGEIWWQGRKVTLHSPKDAVRRGIGMVHQHFRLVRRFTVAENLHIGWSASPRFLRASTLENRARELATRFEIDIDPSAQVGQLSAGEQQRVAILRTLARGAKVVILDEPTSVLTPQEGETLFRSIRALSAEGRTVVFISHKLDEVLKVSDRVTVLRAGRRVATRLTEDCGVRILAQMMVGRDVVLRIPREMNEPGEPVLVARELCALDDRGLLALHNLDLEVCAGEIVGVAGVAGNGQSELSEVLTGVRHVSAGRITVSGKDVTDAGPTDFIRAGVGHIPEDSRSTGLVLSEAIWRSAILKSYRARPIRRGPLLNRRAARQFAHALVASVELSFESVDAPVRHLSGGNAQRLLAGREILAASRLLIAMHPTSGLDIGAIDKVWSGLLAARSAGVGVLLISGDLDEVLSLSDRIVVLYGGRIVGEFSGRDADRQSIGLLMGGATVDARQPGRLMAKSLLDETRAATDSADTATPGRFSRR